jgi:hypothetical protein
MQTFKEGWTQLMEHHLSAKRSDFDTHYQTVVNRTAGAKGFLLQQNNQANSTTGFTGQPLSKLGNPYMQRTFYIESNKR